MRLNTRHRQLQYDGPRKTCSVDGCKKRATVKVLLYDLYLYNVGEVFWEQDFTCPWLCREHMLENERGAKSHDLLPEPADPIGHEPGELRTYNCRELAEMYREPEPTPFRKGRGVTYYPFTNRHQAQGFTIYQPIRALGGGR